MKKLSPKELRESADDKIIQPVWSQLIKVGFWRESVIGLALFLAILISFVRFLAVLLTGDPTPYAAIFGVTLPYLYGAPMNTLLWLFLLVVFAGTSAVFHSRLPEGGLRDHPDSVKPSDLAGFWIFFLPTLGLFWLEYGISLQEIILNLING